MGLRQLVVLSLALFTACATIEEGPSDEELAELDAWAAAADGKADLPTTMSELAAWLRDVYLNEMSAVWNDQEHPATAALAVERVRGLVSRAGVADPSRALYPATVQRLRAPYLDHSEINVVLPGGNVIRLVGDPKGAGVFLDRALFKTSVGPRLCFTWSELETAIAAAYVEGDYGVSFVCHTVTERVLRALDIGSARYASQVRTYASARWLWGPVIPSFNSHDPASWSASRACP